jgi:hypothetical protein
MMRRYDDADGNFVEHFQSTGFDARMWELYLFAVLTEANVLVARPHPAPDFLARALTGEFTLEATTINPSVGSVGQRVAPPAPKNAQEMKPYFQHHLPIRYAGPDRRAAQGILETARCGGEATGVRHPGLPRHHVAGLQRNRARH